MNIVVMSRRKAREYSDGKHGHQSVMISITDPGSCPNKVRKSADNGISDILRLSFEDVDGENGMSDADAALVCNFVKKHIKDKDTELIIVHCEAGISRSAGTAAAILKYLTGSDSQIFNDMYYRPNIRCYRKVLSALYNSD